MPPKVAVVGCGYWGKNLVRNFAQLGALGLLCDASEETLAAQAKLYEGVRATTRFADVLADPAIQGVVLASPAGMHHEQALAALAAGKDIFVEKPLALRYEDGLEIDALAREKGAVLMVGHILHYHPAVQALERLLRDGELGELLYIYSNRLSLGKVRVEENVLWSFAPHDISVITALVGAAPERVSAIGSPYLQDAIADVTVTNLVFPGRVRAHIFVSWLNPFKEQKLVVVGSNKMAVFEDTSTDKKLVVYDKGVDWQNGLPVSRQEGGTVIALPAVEPLREECAHFLACIESRQTPRTDGQNGLVVLQTLAAAQTSLDRGGLPVELREVAAV